MSNSPVFKAPRTVPEISQQYTQLCTQAGHLQYEIATKTKDLDLLNSTLRDLNNEAYAAQQAEKEAKAKADAEAKKSEEPKEEVKE